MYSLHSSTSFIIIHLYRLILTDNAQCGAWATWCAANKRTRNARISHAQNPAFSDAVQFFLYIIDTDAYSHFNIKQSLYSHFEVMLGTPVKPLVLNDNNFASKVNPSRKYPVCEIDTGNLFDEEGDPIFHQQAPLSPEPSALTGEKTKTKRKTGSSLKRTLGTGAKRSRSKKLPPADSNVVVVENFQPSVEIPTPAPAGAPPGVISKPAQKRLSKPYSYPALLCLPVKIAIPLNEHDRDFLNFSFLPCSTLSGNKKFNAFISYCNHSENHGVLVSRAFPSTTITVQGAYLAIRQVCTFLCCQSTSTGEYSMLFPLSLHSLSAWNFQEDFVCRPVQN